MRVLVVSPSGALGGSENIVVNLARHHVEAGFDLSVAVLEDGPLRGALRDIGTDVWEIEAGRVREPHRAALAVRELTRRARRAGIDLVHSSLPKGHIYGRATAWRLGVPSTWSQGSIPTPPGHWTERVACAIGATRVITPSRASGAAQARLSRSPEVEVINPGTDTDVFRPDADLGPRRELGLRDDDVLVGLVGRLERWKNHHEFVAAARTLIDRFPSATFVVVGGTPPTSDDSYERELHELVREAGASERIRFSGDRRDMPAWMASIDVMVNATDGEPFGLVVTEALASGCCVIGVAKGGPAEVITDGVDGLLVPAPTVQHLAAAMERAIGDDALRRRLGAAARTTAVERYSATVMVRRYAELFGSLVGGRSS